MQIVEGKLVLSASDLVGYLECAHLTGLDHSAALGRLRAPMGDDPQLELIRRHGAQHESAYLERLEREGLRVVRIARPTLTLTGLRAAHQQTLAAMRAGAEVISQAAFFDGRWLGYADFLLRRDRSSSLGDWAYDVADTKLARRVRAGALLQMCVHAEHLERAQGTPPEQLIVIAGDGVEHTQSFDGVAAFYRSVKRSFEAALRVAPETYPLPVGHCDVCRWTEVCARRRRDDDHLSLVAFMTREQARKISAAGVTTVAALAAGDPDHIARLGDPTYERLRAQARLQVAQRSGTQVGHELATVEANRGLALLPQPSGGDLFFDMEGDPFAAEGGLEYLFGVTEVVLGTPEHRTFWGTGTEREKCAFEDFIDFVMERLAADPSLHVYHYAP